MSAYVMVIFLLTYGGSSAVTIDMPGPVICARELAAAKAHYQASQTWVDGSCVKRSI